MNLLRSNMPSLAFILALVVASLAYGPGLHGGFLFDDYANLPALGAFGPIDNWPTFWRYITSSTADPTGRPIALLSFLLDAHDWPAAALPFKRTNLLLHLFNSILLALLLHRLGQAWIGRIRLDEATRASLRQRSAWAAVLGSALWLLHPLFVSTTLYIVQREAMLPLTFVLLGLLAWLRGRARLQFGSWLTGTLWCLTGLGGGTLLAVLSKANGVLLPLLALLLECVLLAPWRTTDDVTPSVRRAAHAYRAIQLLALWLPTLSIVAWLLYQGLPDILTGDTHGRPWTIGQRLLTQPRVLVDYLRQLWLPHPYTSGLFNDQIAVSRSPLAPLATLWSILAVFAMLGGAWLARKRWPPLSLAILFYFGGQLIESTVLPLELYFEHRNYLPAVLLFWPLALWICGVPQHASTDVTVPGVRIAPRAIIAMALIVALATMTYARADLWGNTREQALVWAKLNPDSPRAQANAAQLQMAAGHPELAALSLHTALASAPSEVQLALNLFGAECQMGAATPATFAAARHALGTTRDPGTLLTHWFERAIADAREPDCPQADYLHLARLLDAIASNRSLMDKPGRRQDLAYLQGRLALAQGDGASALADFNRALDQQLRVEAALEQAALLGAAGYPELGLEHLSHYDAKVTSGEEYPPPAGMPRLHAWILHRQGYWQKELDRLRATLREDVRNKQERST